MGALTMQMGIREALFALSTAFALPTIAVLLFAYFSGGLKRTEPARYLPVMEPDYDWWAQPATQPDATEAADPALPSSDAVEAGEAL